MTRRRSDRKRLFSLFAGLFLVSLTMTSFGMGTYAWYQAAANATVSAESNVTNITSTKPDDYTFYYYNKNATANYGSPAGTFGSDFEAITSSSLLDGVTSFSEFLPGQKLTFALYIEDVQNINLKITKIKSNNANMQESKHRYICGGSTEINVCEAIDIYSHYCTSDSMSYTSFITSPSGDKFTPTSATAETALDYDSISSNVRTLKAAKQIEVFNITSSTLTTKKNVYVFYTVYFSTDPSILYKEYQETQATNELIVPGTGSPRYFAQSNSGTNNCYAGLDFALNELALSFS